MSIFNDEEEDNMSLRGENLFFFIATVIITCANSELNLRRESEICGGKVHATDLT